MKFSKIASMATTAALIGGVGADHDVFEEGKTDVMQEWFYRFPKIIQSSATWIHDNSDIAHQIFTGFTFNVYNGQSATNATVYSTNSFGITFPTPYKYPGG